MIADITIAFLLFLCLFALSGVISLLDDILSVCRKIEQYAERTYYKK